MFKFLFLSKKCSFNLIPSDFLITNYSLIQKLLLIFENFLKYFFKDFLLSRMTTYIFIFFISYSKCIRIYFVFLNVNRVKKYFQKR